MVAIFLGFKLAIAQTDCTFKQNPWLKLKSYHQEFRQAITYTKPYFTKRSSSSPMSEKKRLLNKSDTVSFIVVFDKKGSITKVVIDRSSGNRATDNEALKLVKEAAPVHFSIHPPVPMVVRFYSGDVVVVSATDQQINRLSEEKK